MRLDELEHLTTTCVLHYHYKLLAFEESMVKRYDVFVIQLFQVFCFLEN